MLFRQFIRLTLFSSSGEITARAAAFYRNHAGFAGELKHFNRIGKHGFDKLSEKQINSSGYVVDTLEAALWCLLQTESYKECVLLAVNLGGDIDAVAAVAGGLAGLYYGSESIPGEWVAAIARREYIEGLCYKLSISLNRAAIEQLCSYIPYFESATKESVCKWDGGEKLGENHYTMPYPVYAQTLDKFIQDVYSSNLMCHNYFEIMEEAGLDTSNEEKIIGAIDSAELDLARAILTGYVRQERFCDGLWASAVEDKVFLKLLKRMQ